MIETKCGTFQDWSFGSVFRRYRIEQKITLRKAAMLLKMDPGNLSKIENSLLNPPSSYKDLKKMCNKLKFTRSQLIMLDMISFNFHLALFKTRWK